MNSARQEIEREDGGIPAYVVWLPVPVTALAFALYFLAKTAPEILWAFNLLDYLRSPLRQAFAALTVLCSVPPILKWMAARTERLGLRPFSFKAGTGGQILKMTLAVACVFVILWIFSEQRMTGDWGILSLLALRGRPFMVKEPGGSFLFFLAVHAGKVFDIEYLLIVRFMVCVSGAIFFVFLHSLTRLLFESRPERLLAIAFLAVPGYVRLFFGHIEVYGFLLCAICAYFYVAILYIKGRVRILLPALFLGIAFWIHLSSAFLVPSLLYLVLKRDTAAVKKGKSLFMLAECGFFFMLPLLFFLVALVVTGYRPSILEEFATLAKYLGIGGASTRYPLIIPFFEPRIFTTNGTVAAQYHFLSRNHALFLANANFILSPAGFLTAAFLIVIYIRRKGLSDPVLKFMLLASLFMLVYSLIIYPFYWAYDWDLFSATAFCYTLVAAYLLFHFPGGRTACRYLAVYLVSFSLFFNTLPLILLGSMKEVRNVGVFSAEKEPYQKLMIQTLGNPETDIRQP